MFRVFRIPTVGDPKQKIWMLETDWRWFQLACGWPNAHVTPFPVKATIETWYRWYKDHRNYIDKQNKK